MLPQTRTQGTCMDQQEFVKGGRVLLALGMALCALTLGWLGGCSPYARGGAPEPTANVEQDLKVLEDHFSASVSLPKLYATGHTITKEDRNQFIAGRLVMMNLRYVRFLREMTADKQLLDSASDILVLSLNIAGAAFADTTTKTVLAAVSASVAGSKVAIDKHYYFEKTLPALIASMNAERKRAIIPLLEGRRREIDEYSMEDAITDLDLYYQAGTLIGGISAVQAEAAEREKKASAEIAVIRGEIDSSLADIRAKSKDAQEALKNQQRRAELINRIETVALSLDAMKQARFIGQVRNAARLQKIRTPAATIADRTAISTTETAMNYIRQQADDIAIGDIVGGLKSQLGLDIPLPQ
jgi:hypothetical protein